MRYTCCHGEFTKDGLTVTTVTTPPCYRCRRQSQVYGGYAVVPMLTRIFVYFAHCDDDFALPNCGVEIAMGQKRRRTCRRALLLSTAVYLRNNRNDTPGEAPAPPFCTDARERAITFLLAPTPASLCGSLNIVGPRRDLHPPHTLGLGGCRPCDA